MQVEGLESDIAYVTLTQVTRFCVFFLGGDGAWMSQEVSKWLVNGL